MSHILVPEWQKPIVKVPLAQAFPELGEVKEFKSKVCLFNHDRTKVFDVVSDRYQVIEHSTAMQSVTSALNKYFDTEIEYNVRSLHGGARIVSSFKLPGMQVKLNKNDVSNITLHLRNSYDRSWVFTALLGAFRLICSNGMIVGETFGALKARHVGLSEESDILTSLESIISKAPKLAELWKEWDDTPVTFDEAGELLTGAFPDKYLEPVLLEDKFPKSKWDLYNDLTYFSTHLTKSLQRRVDFDSKISKIFYGD